jgi:hypothetical protein
MRSRACAGKFRWGPDFVLEAKDELASVHNAAEDCTRKVRRVIMAGSLPVAGGQFALGCDPACFLSSRFGMAFYEFCVNVTDRFR